MTILRVGDRGPDVRAAQAELKARGYYAGLIDGRFNEGLSVAVDEFHENNRLPVNGSITGATLAALGIGT